MYDFERKVGGRGKSKGKGGPSSIPSPLSDLMLKTVDLGNFNRTMYTLAPAGFKTDVVDRCLVVNLRLRVLLQSIRKSMEAIFGLPLSFIHRETGLVLFHVKYDVLAHAPFQASALLPRQLIPLRSCIDYSEAKRIRRDAKTKSNSTFRQNSCWKWLVEEHWCARACT